MTKQAVIAVDRRIFSIISSECEACCLLPVVNERRQPAAQHLSLLAAPVPNGEDVPYEDSDMLPH